MKIGGKFDSISITGNFNKYINKPCQDSACANKIDSTTLLLAVSDGVGSCTHSEKGSNFIVKTIQQKNIIDSFLTMMDYGIETISTEVMLKWLTDNIEDRTLDFISRKDISMHDIHSTLSFAIIRPAFTYIFTIGDSPILVNMKNHTSEIYVGNGWNLKPYTYSIFQSEEVAKFSIVRRLITDEIDSIIIMSDGAERTLFTHVNRHTCDINNMAIRKSLPARIFVSEIKDNSFDKENFIKNLRDFSNDDCSVSYWINI